jgi:hypothetical protein
MILYDDNIKDLFTLFTTILPEFYHVSDHSDAVVI